MKKDQIKEGASVRLAESINKKTYVVARVLHTGDGPFDADVFLYGAPLAVFNPGMLDSA